MEIRVESRFHFILLLLTMIGYSVGGARSQQQLEFQVQPSSQAVPLGGTLILNCVATFTPSLTPSPSSPSPSPFPSSSSASLSSSILYSWQLNGSDVSTTRSNSLLFANYSLYVPHVTLLDIGTYVCLAWPSWLTEETGAIVSDNATVVLAYIEPFSISPPLSVNVSFNSTLRLQCVTGYSAPPALTYWTMNNQAMVSSTGSQLTAMFGLMEAGGAEQISMLLVEQMTSYNQGGLYGCVAVNPLTNQTVFSTSADVNVIVPFSSPEVIGFWPTSLILTEGLPYYIPCQAEGWPPPTTSWLRNGGAISDGLTFQNGTLYLSDVVRGVDDGDYVCLLENSQKTVGSPPINVSVAYLNSTFTLEPSDVTTMAGQSAVINCVGPVSFPPANTTWFGPDGILFVPRSSGTFQAYILGNSSLFFEDVQYSDAGEYFCVVSNVFSLHVSVKSTSATLNVLGSPQITLPPLGLAVALGSLLTLSCLVVGDPAPEVIWIKDGLQLNSTTGDFLLNNMNQELSVASANIVDQGYYSCAASNIYGSVNTVPVFVTVIVPPETLLSMSNVTSLEGDTALMTCSFYASPPALVSWLLDGVVLNVTSAPTKYSLNSSGLAIHNVMTSDTGAYTCIGTNIGGHRSMTASLNVEVLPVMESYPGNLTVKSTQPAVLYCSATGIPQPVITWKFNGSITSVPGDVTLVGDMSTLLIQSPNVNDSGLYTCIATSSIGTDSRNIILAVQVPPTVTSITGDTIILQGNNLSLTCLLSPGIPAPQVMWYKDGVVLVSTQNARIVANSLSLIVKFTNASVDGGLYTCTAENAAGISSASANVYIISVPLSPVSVVVAASQTSVNVSWSPAVQPPYTTVTYFAVQYRPQASDLFLSNIAYIPPTRDWCEVDGLQPAAVYIFRVAAGNVVGLGEYGSDVETETQASAPSAPRNFLASLPTTDSVELQWEEPEETNGLINAYQLQYTDTYLITPDYVIIDIIPPSLPLQMYFVSGLSPFITYSFRVRAANLLNGSLLWGEFNDSVVITTNVAVPSGSPQNFSLTAISSASLLARWETINGSLLNGQLLGYVLRYWPATPGLASSSYNNTVVGGANNLSTVITRLAPWIFYDVEIAGYNVAGLGVFSPVVSARTLPSVPVGSPQDLAAIATSSTTITLQWQPIPVSEQASQIAGYIINYYSNANSNNVLAIQVGSSTILSSVIGNLLPNTTYTVSVQGFTTQVKDGFGPFSSRLQVTTMQDPAVLAYVRSINTTEGSDWIIITWDQPSELSANQISGYIIKINQLDDNNTYTTSDTATNNITASPIASTPTNQTSSSSLISFPLRFNVPSNVTNLTVSNLQQKSIYLISLAAKLVTGIVGIEHNLTAETASPIVITTQEQLPASHPITTELLTTTNHPATPRTIIGLSVPAFIGLVVGCSAAALFLITFLVVHAVWCQQMLKRQVEQRSAYDKRLIYSNARNENIYGENQRQDQLNQLSADMMRQKSNAVTNYTLSSYPSTFEAPRHPADLRRYGGPFNDPYSTTVNYQTTTHKAPIIYRYPELLPHSYPLHSSLPKTSNGYLSDINDARYQRNSDRDVHPTSTTIPQGYA